MWEKIMNSDKRMAELYLERDAGKKHLWFNEGSGKWSDDSPNWAFSPNTKYKLKPETLDEACNYHNDTISTKIAFSMGARWAWANPESKE